jgi:hypothetical protein
MASAEKRQKWADEARARQARPPEDPGPVVFWGYLFALFMPLIGFIIGLTQINRSKHGLWIVLLSIGVVLVYVAVLS